MTVSHTGPVPATATFGDALGVLRMNGLRASSARRVLLEALFAAEEPRSAERLAIDLDGDLASVYRNLETLERVGLVRHFHLVHGPGLYPLPRASAATSSASAAARSGPCREGPRRPARGGADPLRAAGAVQPLSTGRTLRGVRMSFEVLFTPFEEIDAWLTGLLSGAPLLVALGIAFVLGLRHASTPTTSWRSPPWWPRTAATRAPPLASEPGGGSGTPARCSRSACR